MHCPKIFLKVKILFTLALDILSFQCGLDKIAPIVLKSFVETSDTYYTTFYVYPLKRKVCSFGEYIDRLTSWQQI